MEVSWKDDGSHVSVAAKSWTSIVEASLSVALSVVDLKCCPSFHLVCSIVHWRARRAAVDSKRRAVVDTRARRAAIGRFVPPVSHHPPHAHILAHTAVAPPQQTMHAPAPAWKRAFRRTFKQQRSGTAHTAAVTRADGTWGQSLSAARNRAVDPPLFISASLQRSRLPIATLSASICQQHSFTALPSHPSNCPTYYSQHSTSYHSQQVHQSLAACCASLLLLAALL